MEVGALLALGVVVPRMDDALGEALRIVDVLGRDLRELRIRRTGLEVLDDTVAADQEVVEEIAVRRARRRLDWIRAIREHTRACEAAAVDTARLDVRGADGDEVGDIVIVDERAAEIDGAVDDAEARGVHRRVAVRHGDGARHAADDIVRMRVLAAEDDMRRHEFALLVEHFKIMRDRHEMDFRRQQLVVRMIPPVRREDAELAALDDGLDLALDFCEILRRRGRECMVVRLRHARAGRAERQTVGIEHRGLQVRRRDRIGRERLDRADPVERMQMIEMDDMILHRQRRRHDVADVVRVFRNTDLERILDGAHRSERMRRRADAADALDIGPRITRVAVVHDELEAAPGRAGRQGIRDFARTLVHIDLDAQMAFDSRDRIDYYMFHLSSTCSLKTCLLLLWRPPWLPPRHACSSA